MSDFFSAYLFLVLAVILLIASLIFNKQKWLFWCDAICWVFAGIYALTKQDPTQPFIAWLGIFCIIMFLLTGILPIFMNREKKIKRDMNDINNWENDDENKA
jgi:hypothetical protein